MDKMKLSRMQFRRLVTSSVVQLNWIHSKNHKTHPNAVDIHQTRIGGAVRHIVTTVSRVASRNLSLCCTFEQPLDS